MGVPPMESLFHGKSHKKWMMTRGTPISGHREIGATMVDGGDNWSKFYGETRRVIDQLTSADHHLANNWGSPTWEMEYKEVNQVRALGPLGALLGLKWSFLINPTPDIEDALLDGCFTKLYGTISIVVRTVDTKKSSSADENYCIKRVSYIKLCTKRCNLPQ